MAQVKRNDCTIISNLGLKKRLERKREEKVGDACSVGIVVV